MNAAAAPSEPRPLGLVAVLLLPIILVDAVTFLVPMLALARMSLNESLPGGAVKEAIRPDNYLSVATDSFYLELVGNTLVTAAGVTLLALLCSYPIALFIHRVSPRWRNLAVVAVISPLLVSAVVRTYGWMLILGDQGAVNSFLKAIGLVDEPLRLIFNRTGVMIGLTQILMPYMILSLMAGFGRLDPSYEEAAFSLGARRWRTFTRVTLPLTLPGIMLGSLLCFVLTISSFITPKLLGGGRVFLLATEIYDQAIVTLNWPVASTLSVLVLLIFGTVLAFYGRLAKALD